MKKFIKSKKNFLKQLKCISRLFKIPVSFLLTKIKLRPDISIIRTYAYEFRKNKKKFFQIFVFKRVLDSSLYK